MQRSGTAGLDALFTCSPAVKELCSIVDKVTYQGVCDLMLCHPDVSLRFAGLDDPSVVGALLERQLECLEPHLTKKSVQAVAAGLLKDATEVYACAGMPLRRARVFIKSLIFAYHCGLDIISQIGTPDAIVVDILALVSEVRRSHLSICHMLMKFHTAPSEGYRACDVFLPVSRHGSYLASYACTSSC